MGTPVGSRQPWLSLVSWGLAGCEFPPAELDALSVLVGCDGLDRAAPVSSLTCCGRSWWLRCSL